MEGLAGSKEADKNKSAQKCTVNTDEQKSTPLGVETQVSLQDAVHRNETYSDTGQLLTSDSDKDTKSSSTSESVDSCLETNDIMRKKETRDFTNSVLLTGPSWQCKTPSPSPSLANSETHDSISQGDMDEPRDTLNPNFGTALSPQDNGLANRYSFSESMQMSYSRHRRATSRDLKLSDPSSPGIVKRNTLFSTRSQSRVSNITEETPEDLVSDMAVETCSALVFTLGPRIAGRFLVEELLTQTAIWFETSTLADDRSIGKWKGVFMLETCYFNVILLGFFELESNRHRLWSVDTFSLLVKETLKFDVKFIYLFFDWNFIWNVLLCFKFPRSFTILALHQVFFFRKKS